MKLIALAIAAGLVLLSAQTVLAQESSRLSAEYLKQASPAIHWSQGLQPRKVDVFVHKEAWIDAPAEIVWANLIDAEQWPKWYSNSADVSLQGGYTKPARDVTFNWKTFGFPIASTVDVFEPNREIGWNVDSPVSRCATPGCRFPSGAEPASLPRKLRRTPVICLRIGQLGWLLTGCSPPPQNGVSKLAAQARRLEISSGLLKPTAEQPGGGAKRYRRDH